MVARPLRLHPHQLHDSVREAPRPAHARDLRSGPRSVPLGGSTPLTFKVDEPESRRTCSRASPSTDALPPGLVVSTPNGLERRVRRRDDRGRARARAPISLTGATSLHGETCTFSVNVTGVYRGLQERQRDGDVGRNGPGQDRAQASLKVGLPPPFLFFASDPGDRRRQGQTFTLTAGRRHDRRSTGSRSGDVSVHVQHPRLRRRRGLSPSCRPSGVAVARPASTRARSRWPFQSPVVRRPRASAETGAAATSSRAVSSSSRRNFGPAGTSSRCSRSTTSSIATAPPPRSSARSGTTRSSPSRPGSPSRPPIAYEGRRRAEEPRVPALALDAARPSPCPSTTRPSTARRRPDGLRPRRRGRRPSPAGQTVAARGRAAPRQHRRAAGPRAPGSR